MLTGGIGLLSSRKSGIPTDGLIGEWLFSGNANDTSGNGYDGTVNGATLTTDRHGNPNSAYDFNGTSDYIQLAGSYPDIGSIDFSVSAWAYFDNVNKNGHIVSFRELASGTGFSLTQDLSLSNGVDMRVNSANQQFNLATSIGTWYHFVVTADRDGLMSGYVDGSFDVSVDISTAGNFTNSTSPAFGIRNDFILQGFLDGKIDDIRIYNRILTTDEITELYNE